MLIWPLLVFPLSSHHSHQHLLGPHIEIFPVEQLPHANPTLAINTRSPSFVNLTGKCPMEIKWLSFQNDNIIFLKAFLSLVAEQFSMASILLRLWSSTGAMNPFPPRYSLTWCVRCTTKSYGNIFPQLPKGFLSAEMFW